MSAMIGRWSEPSRGPPCVAILANGGDANTLSIATSGRSGTLPHRIGQVRWSVLKRLSPVAAVKRSSFSVQGTHVEIPGNDERQRLGLHELRHRRDVLAL
jgi:hypothetical protein